MNTKTSREKLLRATFNEPKRTIGGLELRPFSDGVFDLCLELELKMFTLSREDAEKLSPKEKSTELVAVFYLLSQPEDLILEAVAAGPEKFRKEYLRPFALDVPMSVLPEIAKLLSATADQAEVAAVDVEPKPELETAKDAPTPPPNS